MPELFGIGRMTTSSSLRTSRSASRSTWRAVANGSRMSRLIVRLPVSTRLMVDGLRLVRAASSSSDRPSVFRKTPQTGPNHLFYFVQLSHGSSANVLRISQVRLRFSGSHRIVVAMSDHAPRPVERHCDVAVIGGSAAGLAAALQLGRQRRSVIVVDAGEPRNAPRRTHARLPRS